MRELVFIKEHSSIKEHSTLLLTFVVLTYLFNFVYNHMQFLHDLKTESNLSFQMHSSIHPFKVMSLISLSTNTVTKCTSYSLIVLVTSFFKKEAVDGLYNRETETGYPPKSFSEQSFKNLWKK